MAWRRKSNSVAWHDGQVAAASMSKSGANRTMFLTFKFSVVEKRET